MNKEKHGGAAAIDFTNFHSSTRATFQLSTTPAREPDFVSRSGSAYWDEGKGVVRSSDHWAGIGSCMGQASCVWDLRGAPSSSGWLTGFCLYEAFFRRVWTGRVHQVSESDVQLARRIEEAGGALADYGHLAVPVWARISFRGSSHAAPEALPVLNAGAEKAVSADPTMLRHILSGAPEITYGRVLA